MTTENDIIFDNIYEEVSPLLDHAIDDAVETIIQEFDVSLQDTEKILDAWFNASAPSERFIAKNAEQIIKEEKNKCL
tara:strand:+ start:5325 stop:5555 length:231 start_codon:yes stop_codon:yes gene_type:complete